MASIVCEMAHAKGRKAVEEDGIGGEVLKVAPWSLARARHPLFVKSALPLRPPLQGMIPEFLKANASGGECSHYRGITIADHIAKMFCKMFRPEIVPAPAAVVPTGRFGAGFKGGSPDIAHLALFPLSWTRPAIGEQNHEASASSATPLALFAALDAASVARRSAVILFLWILLRRLRRSCGGCASRSMQVTSSGLRRLLLRVAARTTLGVSMMTPPVMPTRAALAIAAALHHMTWFTTEGLPRVVGTSRGSQAGMLLADVMFITAAGRVADKVAEGLAAAGVSARLPHDATACLFGDERWRLP